MLPPRRCGEHAGETLDHETASQVPRQEEALWRSSTSAGLVSIRRRSWPVCGGPGERRPRTSEVRTFGTTPDELGALADWLMREGVTHVAMESTGVYWK